MKISINGTPHFLAILAMPIFAGQINGKRTRTNRLTRCKSRVFRCVLIMPYGHTFATHALASGVDAKTLSGILGHTNASFTLNTYTHVTTDMQRQAAVIVENFMEDIFGKELKPWQSEENAAMAAST